MSRSTLKTIVRLLLHLATLPLVAIFYVLRPVRGADSAFMGMSQFLSLLPGASGILIRGAALSQIGRSISPDASIGFLTTFSHANTEIEENVYIGAQCNIGMCRIGKHCLFGSGVHLLSGKHQHGFSEKSKPIKDQPGVFTKIAVGENCWIGNNVTVMADVGSHCIVAAGSVVIQPVPDNSIVAGNPAKVVKQLDG